MTLRFQNDPEALKAIEFETPMKEWTKPEDVAKAVVLLSSQDTEMVTGMSFSVDGGLQFVVAWF
jgi:NAD(P)-dependent dehydrogenase (short-subunit alcohol dehydrogenase family)